MSSATLATEHHRAAGSHPPKSELHRGRRQLGRGVEWCSWLTLAALIGVYVLICRVSEDWWFSAALTYLPRSPYLIPPAILFVAAAWVRWRAIVPNLVSLLLAAGPIMGWNWPSHQGDRGSAHTIRILSSNCQNGASSLPKLIIEYDRLKPDVLVMQEALDHVGDLEKYLADWNSVDVGEFWIASRFPVKLIGECHSHAFDRRSAILAEVQTSHGPVLVASVHLSTPRYGLSELSWHSPFTEAGIEEVKEYQKLREYEMKETRNWLNEAANGRPLIIGGDFNTPAGSSLFKAHWAGFINGFEQAGLGYGYTAPCNTNRIWPPNTPWVRIDHMLYTSEWAANDVEIGHTDGSDHRLIWADMRPTSVPSPEN